MLLPLLLPALVLLGGGLWFLTQGRRRVEVGRSLERGGVVTHAEILDLRFETQTRNVAAGDGFWVPVVRFTTTTGVPVEAATLTGARPAPGRVGDRVEVRYDPQDPRRVELASGPARASVLGGTWAVLGGLLCGFGLVLLVVWGLLFFVVGLGR